jgi:hypothetical protein
MVCSSHVGAISHQLGPSSSMRPAAEAWPSCSRLPGCSYWQQQHRQSIQQHQLQYQRRFDGLRRTSCQSVATGKLYLEPVLQQTVAFAPATIANLGPGFDWMGCAVEVAKRCSS